MKVLCGSKLVNGSNNQRFWIFKFWRQTVGAAAWLMIFSYKTSLMEAIILLLTSMAVLVTPASAQQDSVVFEYGYLNSSGNIDSRSIQIKLEFGTGTDALEYLKDPETGKPKKFNSVVDALNDMGKKGWGINFSDCGFGRIGYWRWFLLVGSSLFF
jgi:hypothetical protein